MKDLHTNGTWREPASGATAPVVNPFDGEVPETVSVAGPEEIAAAVTSARNAFYGPWRRTSSARRAAVAELLTRDREELARIESLDTGKTLTEGRALRKGFCLRPTVLGDCTGEMRVVREEVFGPVVTVEPFGTQADAIAPANDSDYRPAGALRHGTVWLNDYHPYLPQAEWGGSALVRGLTRPRTTPVPEGAAT